MTDSQPVPALDAKTKRRLRQIAHHLNPVVNLGDGGISEGVINETNRALTDHELIKVRINALDRSERNALGSNLADACAAAVVQRIGKVIVLFRENPKADPKLSNLTRLA